MPRGGGEAERAAAGGREKELEEEGGEMERDADSWVESTEEESDEEGGRAKGTMEGRSDGETARGSTTESVALVLRDRRNQRAIPSTMKGKSRLIQILGTERREWSTRELWNAQRSRMSELVTGITGAPRGQGRRGKEPRSTVQTCWTKRHPVLRGSPPKAVEKMGVGEGRSRLQWGGRGRRAGCGGEKR